MQTKPLYLDDSYQKTMEARVQEVVQEPNGDYRVRLDQTVFYPMGGGQATDQGMLSSDGLSAQIYQVMMKDGDIWHYLKTQTAPHVGTKVTGEINWDRRYTNMKKHTAGHVVDFAMYVLGYSPSPLMPYKGDHNKKLFIQYQGTVGKDIRQELEQKANELVAQNVPITWEFTSFEALQKEAIYLQPYLPKNKPLRIIRLEGVGAVADGGTQLKTTGELGSITIPVIDGQSGETIVHYTVET
ncbi:alanyl-tRNA editing protein [Candidatus Woesebacteria bacterium]|nr:alanyl-tRNA editing protein [Candidatus Woesebacteria bacterium]